MVGLDGAESVPVQGKRDHLRNLVGWLTLVPLVLMILFCSGQISVWGLRTRAAQDVHSQLTANYKQWPFEEVAPLNPAVLDIIRREDGLVEGIEPVVSGVFLPTPTPAFAQPGSTRTPTSVMVARASSPTSTQTAKSATQTPLPTQTALPPTVTQTLATPSATVTRASTKTTSPSATRTVTLTPSRTATYFLVWVATRTRTSTHRPADTTAPTSTSTSTQLVSSTATQTLNPSPSLTVTRTPSATFIPPVTITQTSAPTRTYTSAPTITSTSIQVSTPTFTPTFTPTVTDTPIVLVTPTPTVTLTPTDSFTPIETLDRTPIPMNTDTPEPTETSTDTPEPTQIPLPPGINIGPGDGSYTEIGCGGGILVDLGSQTWIGGLVYYEVENPTGPGTIALDWAIVSVSANSTGPWTLIFYWGDSNSGNNGYVPAIYYPPENDNQTIGFGELYNQTGIRIDVAGTYRYVLIEAPPGCDDPAQVDAIQVLP
jgi:hypothetical protein